MNVSLKCPLSLSRIIHPGRGVNCKHINCFNIETFINMYRYNNSSSNSWQCPHCPNIIKMKDLLYDRYFAGILEETEGYNFVEINNDGSYKVINENKKRRIMSSEIKKEIICIDVDK